MRPKRDLIRFVIGPGETVVPDIAGKLPGRGLYVTSRREVLDRALAKNLFSKAARQKVSADPQLAALVETLLRQHCLQGLGLLRKAGGLTFGFEKVLEQIRSRKTALLISARDGAADGRQKLLKAVLSARAAQRGTGERVAQKTNAPLPCLVGLFTSAELALALGRENVVHASAVGLGSAERLVGFMRRLDGFCEAVAPDWAPGWIPEAIGPVPAHGCESTSDDNPLSQERSGGAPAKGCLLRLVDSDPQKMFAGKANDFRPAQGGPTLRQTGAEGGASSSECALTSKEKPLSEGSAWQAIEGIDRADDASPEDATKGRTASMRL